MVESVLASELTLGKLQDYFGLQLTCEPTFFPEWKNNLLTLSEEEQRTLLRVKRNYANLVSRQPLLEEGVKMVVLSPLLDLAGFYEPPFSIETETSVEVAAEDDGILVKGKIDVLVIKQRLWVLVIESKSSKFDVLAALPQALAYMFNTPNSAQPVFGFLINGREFVCKNSGRGS